MSPCFKCEHYAVLFCMKTRQPGAVGRMGVWVAGCKLKKLRFGTFAEIASGEGRMPDECGEYEGV